MHASQSPQCNTPPPKSIHIIIIFVISIIVTINIIITIIVVLIIMMKTIEMIQLSSPAMLVNHPTPANLKAFKMLLVNGRNESVETNRRQGARKSVKGKVPKS